MLQNAIKYAKVEFYIIFFLCEIKLIQDGIVYIYIYSVIFECKQTVVQESFIKKII